MVAERASGRRVVTLARERWPAGYWIALMGCDVRMPAVVESGRVLAGFLVAAEETSEEIVLTFEELAPEE